MHLGFSEFKWKDVNLSMQKYEDSKSKYFDLYDKTRLNQQIDALASILEKIDQLDLIRQSGQIA